MFVADSHCDTLVKFPDDPFNSEDAAWNIRKFRQSKGILQYMAVFINPDFSGSEAMARAANFLGNFWRRRPDIIQPLLSSNDYDDSKINVLLAIEGAAPLINDISNLYAFHRMGVRAITLTWNHRNFLGDGVDEDFGLTKFGKEVIKEMQKLNMMVDVSHLNEAGFRDVAETIEGPYMATHSNARDLCEHKRNLKKDQIIELVKRRGYIGLNFYDIFLSDKHDKNHNLDKLIQNIEYFLDLGAGDCLGLGADFDGMDESPIEDVAGYPILAELMDRKLDLSQEQIEKIMYKNLVNYTLKMLPE